MAKTIVKRPSKGGTASGRLLAKATFTKAKLKSPGKPAPKPAKPVTKSTRPPLAVKPAQTKPVATKVGVKATLTPDRAALAGKNPSPKSTKTVSAAIVAAPVNGRSMRAPDRSLAGAKPVSSVTPKAIKTKIASIKAAPPKASTPKPPPVIIPSPVPTDGKPRKNQAGLSSKELEFYRELLLQKRRELVGDMSSMEREALRSANSNLSSQPVHMADQGTDNYEQEFTLGLVEKDRNLLREINRALGKIQAGTYGICEGTGKPISKPRLEAQPWAKFSIEYARELEKGGVRR